MSSFQRQCKLLFIRRYVKIVLLEWHKHSFCRRRLKYCGKHKLFPSPKRCVCVCGASLGRALFIHEAMHHGGLRHLGKRHFRSEKYSRRANIENNNSPRCGGCRQAIANRDRCMSIVISNEKFPSEMCALLYGGGGVRSRTPSGLVSLALALGLWKCCNLLLLALK